MGTHSTQLFVEKNNEKETPLVNIYTQYDGYIDGVGHQLAEFLLSKKIVNGIPGGMNTSNYANGFGCLIASYIKSIKKEAGNVYITNLEDKEEYNYKIIFDNDKYFTNDYESVNDLITIEIDSYPKFKGTPEELLNFKESDKDE